MKFSSIFQRAKQAVAPAEYHPDWKLIFKDMSPEEAIDYYTKKSIEESEKAETFTKYDPSRSPEVNRELMIFNGSMASLHINMSYRWARVVRYLGVAYDHHGGWKNRPCYNCFLEVAENVVGIGSNSYALIQKRGWN